MPIISLSSVTSQDVRGRAQDINGQVWRTHCRGKGQQSSVHEPVTCETLGEHCEEHQKSFMAH